MEQNNEYTGAVKISEEVVAILAGKAVKEVEGIAGMSGNIVDSFAAVVLGKKDAVRGIDVDMKEDNVTITLHTKVKYGVRIPEVAWKVQENVKNTVESMTGLTVLKVNINVDGVEFEPAAEEKKGEPEQPGEAEIIDVDVVDEEI